MKSYRVGVGVAVLGWMLALVAAQAQVTWRDGMALQRCSAWNYAEETMDDLAFGQSIAVSGNKALIGSRFPGWFSEYEHRGEYFYSCFEEDGHYNGEVSLLLFTGTRWRKVDTLEPFYSFPIAACLNTVEDQIAYDRFVEWYGGVEERIWLDDYGYSVALRGNLALVGAPSYQRHWNNSSWNVGGAFLFELDPADPTRTLKSWRAVPPAASRENGSRYGAAVDVDTTSFVAGAPKLTAGGPAHSGGVFFYEKNADGNWSCLATLRKDWPEAEDHLGYSVAVRGRRVLAGAPENDSFGNVNCGGAYVFDVQGANQRTVTRNLLELVPAADRGGAHAAFGEAVALDGSYAVVGAPFAGNNDLGRVHVFQCSTNGTWNCEATLINPSANQWDVQFGRSVSLDVSQAVPRLVVGSMRKTWVYERVNGLWVRLGAVDGPTPGSIYGGSPSDCASVALSGSHVLTANARVDDLDASECGMVFSYYGKVPTAYFSNVGTAVQRSAYTPSVKAGTKVFYTVHVAWDPASRLAAADKKVVVSVWDVRGMTSIGDLTVSGSAGSNLAASSGETRAMDGNMPVRFQINHAKLIPAGEKAPSVIIRAFYTPAQ